MAGAVDYILRKHRFQVVVPCVVARLTNGDQQYVYRDGLLPENTLQAQIDHMVEHGMVRAFSLGGDL